MRTALVILLVALGACATQPKADDDGLKAATEFCGTGKPDCFIP